MVYVLFAGESQGIKVILGIYDSKEYLDKAMNKIKDTCTEEEYSLLWVEEWKLNWICNRYKEQLEKMIS